MHTCVYIVCTCSSACCRCTLTAIFAGYTITTKPLAILQEEFNYCLRTQARFLKSVDEIGEALESTMPWYHRNRKRHIVYIVCATRIVSSDSTSTLRCGTLDVTDLPSAAIFRLSHPGPLAIRSITSLDYLSLIRRALFLYLPRLPDKNVAQSLLSKDTIHFEALLSLPYHSEVLSRSISRGRDFLSTLL